jgi:hypothetical protein
MFASAIPIRVVWSGTRQGKKYLAFRGEVRVFQYREAPTPIRYGFKIPSNEDDSKSLRFGQIGFGASLVFCPQFDRHS